MKDKIKNIISALGFIIVILFVIFGCDRNNIDEESPIITVCGEDIYVSDYNSNGIEWDSLSKDIDETCKTYYEEYYYENPEEICKEE
jgi:hypothetical protein